PVVTAVGGIVAEQLSGTAVVGDQQVGVAVVVIVAAGSAATHALVGERRAAAVADLFEAAISPAAAEQVILLAIGGTLADQLRVRLDVAVGDEGVFEAIVIVVEEAEAEADVVEMLLAGAG